MGLDMYLTKSHYIGAEYEHRNVKGKIEITIDGEPVKIDFKKVSSITEAAAYWRKENHIHKWFVDNVQDGEDNCQEYYVSADNIRQLLEDCKQALANRDKAPEVLPTQPGFFFGGTEYDEYYFKGIEYTAGVCEEILKDVDKDGRLPYSLQYSSSW